MNISKFLIVLLTLCVNVNLFSQKLAKVYAVHDGDSYKIEYLDDSLKTDIYIRLQYVDCPEVRSNRIRSDQAGGRMVADSMRSLLKGKIVTVDTVYRDIYNRPVSKVYLDSTDISEYVLSKGYGWYVNDGTKNIDPKYKKVYLKARRQKIGIWSNKDIIKPSVFRNQNGY